MMRNQMSYGLDFSQMAGHESLHKFNIQQAHWHSDQISQFLDSLAVFPNQWTAFIDIKQAQTSAQWVVRHYGISRRDSKTSLVRRLIVDGMRQLRGIKD